jgi:hypothetical protein
MAAKEGPMKFYSSADGNNTYELTIPFLFSSLKTKFGLETGIFDGVPGFQSFTALADVVTSPDGQTVESKTSIGDTAIWRPQYALVPIVVLSTALAVLLASYITGPAGASQALQQGQTVFCKLFQAC